MFTGLVACAGDVTAVRQGPAGQTLHVSARSDFFASAEIGDSVALSGVCLTVVDRRPGAAAFEVSKETLSRTTLGALTPGDRVNLELPLRASDRLGGHFVQGHVDAVGSVIRAGGTEDDYRVRVRHPEPRWVVEKGSVAVDGVSLTVARVARVSVFEVMLIPHTRAVTTLGALEAGDRVNVEYDILAKYVENLMRNAPG